MPEDLNSPIPKIRVQFSSPSALLAEFTRSVGRGTLAFETHGNLPNDTRVQLILSTPGIDATLEVNAQVVRTTPRPKGLCLAQIQYESDGHGLETLIQHFLSAEETGAKRRRQPRVPIVCTATEETPYSPQYTLKDVSAGGLRMDVEAPLLPAHIVKGTLCLFELHFNLGKLSLPGTVAWTYNPPQSASGAPSRPAFGVAFHDLSADIEENLRHFMALKKVPSSPWKARLRFGPEAHR